MAPIEFQEWPKTPRLLRNIVITEKIDGTNAAIGIVPISSVYHSYPSDADFPELEDITVLESSVFAKVAHEGEIYGVYAQSRTRLITPGKSTDNYGFAGWVQRNAAELVDLLGEGLHYGEWWGAGIQRKYGMAEKWFSLFNTARHAALETDLTLAAVPVLYEGPNDTAAITRLHEARGDLHLPRRVPRALETLRTNGSAAAPGQISKVTLDKEDAGKWETV